MSEIIGNKGGEKEHVHYEAPDSLHSTSFARVLDLVSEGEILGLTDGLESVYLNDTPVQNPDGTKNFKDVSIDFRTGTQTQDYIPGFPDVENEVAINVELKSSTPWVRAISNTALSAVRITLGVPALSQQDTKNGDVKGYKVDYKIELAKDGGAYAAVLTSSFNGKTTTAYQRSARIDLPAATTGWQVRVTRLTANANTAAIADTTTIVSFTEVIDAKLRYPMSAIVGIQVDAKQFQSVPTRAYDLMGRIIQVPSNYNAKTRAYTGNWDGTFKPSWTDNPAWIFRDLALNDRYGLGHRITAAQLDKWSLYAIARYCDGLVPDGKGGMEPRFTCNLYLQTQKQAYAVLQDLASIFRGISYWGAGSIIASADMPTDPVYVYTAANVIGGKFSRVGSSKKTRYTTALVSWNDPADMYKAKVEYTEDPEGIVRYGIQQTSLTAFGCSSQGQAQRVGRWALATSRLETEMISFDVGMDGAIALPGQIIRVADPSRMGRRNGGRIKTASGRVVVLDKAPIINAGDKLTVILPTGKSETRVVASIAGDAVTVTADWTALPVAQSVWSVDSTVLIAPTYKVRSVTEKDAVTYTISATQHEPGKFDFIELGTAITPRPETALNSAVQQPPASVTVTAYTVSLQDVQKLGFTATCPAVDGAIAYEGAFQADNGNWFTMPRQPGPVFDVLDVLAGYYTVKIAAVNAIGITSIETVSAPTLVSKNANPKNAGIVLSPSASGFNVAADGTITPASITVHADLLDLEGIVSWSAVGATITSSNNNTVIEAVKMPGAAATITASIIALGQTFTRSIDIVKSADGAAGAQNFAWIKYGTSTTGAGLTDNPEGMTYIGLAVNKSTATESTNPADYVWSLIKGSNGADGASTFTGVIYKQQVGAPATPTGGTFNFATTTLTPPSGWTATRPASSTTPTWACRYLFVAATIGGTVTAGTWAAPVNDGQNGADGAIGPQIAPAYLWQWGSAAPAAPTGTSTLNLVTGANTSYTGSDGWATTPPASPGNPSLRLYIATKMVTASGGATSVPSVSYSGATVSAWSGANGANGANGAQAREIKVFQWALTIPVAPSGTGALSWATGLFGGAPANWSLAPGAVVPGYTQWSAKVLVTDTATATSTPFSWSTASIGAETFAGGDGLSYVTAYVATTVGTASTAPAPTTGRNSLPPANSSGLPGTPQATVPTLAAGQYQMQFDGSYNKATDQITWSIPYQTALKVGNLSAIATNTGALTVSGTISSANGNFQVDANGNAIMKALASYAPDGALLFSSGGGLTLAGAPAETLNSNQSLTALGLSTQFIGRGVSVVGNSLTKIGVDGNWNSDARSKEGFIGGAYASAVIDALGEVFFGLNTDPDQNFSYETIDFAFYTNASGGIFHYQNGVEKGLIGYYAPGDCLSMQFDGSNLGMTNNGVLLTGVNASGRWPATATAPLFFDSSFKKTGSSISNVRFGGASSNNWGSIGGTGKPADNATVGAPVGTLVAGVSADAVAAATTNFNTSNDRNGAAVLAPTVIADGFAVDHTLRTDGSADVSFEWQWSGAEGDIDGFLVYVYRSPTGGAYTFGTSPADEQVYTVPASKRAFIQFGTGANVYITFGVQAYRAVDKDINAGGVIKTAIVKSALGAENPYLPSTSVAFAGNITGTVNGIAAADVNVWSAVSGAGKPQDGATVGGTLGVNIGGQITSANAAALVGANALTNTMIGGDLLSTNWNGRTDGAGRGWALGRESGTLLCNDVILRGSLRNGLSQGWSYWPPAGGGAVAYFGEAGFQLGNFNDGRFIHAYANGDLYMPGFSHVNKQLTLDNPIIIRPDLTNGAPAVTINSSGFNVTFTNGGARNIGNFAATITGGRAPFQYTWNEIGGEGGFMLTSGTTSTVTIRTVGGYDQTREGLFSLTIKDANGFTATATMPGTARFGNGG